MKFLVEITLIDNTTPTPTELKNYIEEALSCYSGCYDPEDDLFFCIKDVKVEEVF